MLWDKMLINNINSHYVITINKKVIGFLTINLSRDADLIGSVYELVGLYLDPDYVCKGFGKKIMVWIKDEIKSRGYNTISLWVLSENHRAINFYKKSGFSFDGNSKPSGLAVTVVLRYVYNNC